MAKILAVFVIILETGKLMRKFISRIGVSKTARVKESIS